MTTGLLWFSNDPATSLKDKILAAMNFYRMKYGATPNYCETNPEWATEDEMPIETRFIRGIPPKHLWLGVKD
jgi:hypothetical protein